MSIVTYKGTEWSLLETTNRYILEPALIDRPASAACYPSNSSCWVQSGPNKVLEGGCNRASYYRMIGEPQTDPPGEYSAYINEHGKYIEQFLIDKWMKMGIWVSNNIRFYVPAEGPEAKYGVPVSGEIDAFIRKPGTKDLKNVYIAEIKSYYKWFKKRELMGTKDEPGKPSYNNLFQLMIYLDVFSHMGIDKGKLMYTARDEACQVEFDVTMKKINGYTYAVVNGVPDMTFTFEGIIDRFKELCDYYKRRELPPREFKLVYDTLEIERMYQAGMISKTKYTDFQKGKAVGDWNCLAADSKVLTDNGWKSIKDVTPSADSVMTREGWKRVIRAEKMGTKKTVKLKTNVFLPLELTDDHKVLVSTIENKRTHVSKQTYPLSKYKYDIINNFDFKEVRDIDLSKSNYVAMPIDKKINFDSGDFWESAGTEERILDHLEFLAAYVSDGNKEGDMGIAISFGDAEKDLADRMAALMGRIGFTNVAVRNSGHGWSLRTYDKDSLRLLLWPFVGYENGGTKADSKYLTSMLTQAPYDVQHKFLEMLHYYDGCKTKNRGKEVWAYSTSSKTLAVQLQHMYFRNGCIAGLSENVREFTNYCSHPKPRYMLSFYPKAEFNYGFIYNDVVYQQIAGIDLGNENVDVYDIEVDGVHEFTTSAGIVHNCSYCNYKTLCWGDKYSDLSKFTID